MFFLNKNFDTKASPIGLKSKCRARKFWRGIRMLERETRLELATTSLGNWDSTTELFPRGTWVKGRFEERLDACVQQDFLGLAQGQEPNQAGR